MIFKKKNILEKKWLQKFNFELRRQLLHNEIVYKACDNQFFVNQIKNNCVIINLGCGYGIWTHNVSILCNNSCFVNIDIVDYYKNFCEEFVEEGIIQQPNIYFKKIDLKKENINFKDNNVDFIYQRDMLSVYNFIEWQNIIKEMKRVLKKDGYIELVEFDFIIKNKKNINDKFSKIVNNYLIDVFKKNNYIYKPNILINLLNENFIINKSDVIKLPLYYNDTFKDHCIEDLIISYEHVKNEIERISSCKFDELISKLKNEWVINKSYIELYIISAKNK